LAGVGRFTPFFKRALTIQRPTPLRLFGSKDTCSGKEGKRRLGIVV